MERSSLFKKIFIAIFLLLILYLYGFLYYSFPPNPERGFTPFRVTRGESVNQVSLNLKKYKIIKNPSLFTAFSILTREEHRIPSGLYFLKESMNELMCFKSIRFKFALSPSLKITIPEGYNLREISSLVSMRFDIPFDSIYSFFASKEKIRPIFEKYGIEPAPTLEGYIFPDTYILPSSTTPYEIALRAVEKLKEILKDLGYDTLKNNMALHEILTLASIVEKEAVFDFEKPIIASVFFNRLKKGIPLQADPTVKYALGTKKGRLTLEDIEVVSPYNTYRHKGLPPGPICSPGKASLKAVLYPEDTEYLYFVAKGDGTHYFSKSFKEHKKKKFIYRKRWNF